MYEVLRPPQKLQGREWKTVAQSLRGWRAGEGQVFHTKVQSLDFNLCIMGSC